MRSVLTAALGLLLMGVACSSDSKGPAVRVTATDSACTPEKTELAPGTVTFEIKNDATKVNELYVYGDGDKIVGEVENVGPGTTKKLSVKLETGKHYELACKPGQSGRGIRVPLTVQGG
jgi:iron uptake system component EfeO